MAKLSFEQQIRLPCSGFTLSEIEPRLFSFNSPYGACPECDGLGTQAKFDPALVIPDRNKTLAERAIAYGAAWRGRGIRDFFRMR